MRCEWETTTAMANDGDGDDHFYLFSCPFQSIIASISIIYHVHNTYVLITFGPMNVESLIFLPFRAVPCRVVPWHGVVCCSSSINQQVHDHKTHFRNDAVSKQIVYFLFLTRILAKNIEMKRWFWTFFHQNKIRKQQCY